MEHKNTKIWVALVVIGIIAIGSYLYKGVSLGSGNEIEQFPIKFIKGLHIGNPLTQNAKRLELVSEGTCTLLANFSITATTTRSVDCAVSEARSGDVVFVQLARSTAMAQQYVVKSANASTTSGFISVDLLNLTGASAVPSATSGFGSSTTYVLYRFQ